MILYVTQSGAGLYCRGEQLQVCQGKKILARVHLFELEQVVLMGKISLSAEAMNDLLERGIEVILLRSNGQYRGRLIGPERRNIPLRQMQFRRCEDATFRLAIARRLVSGKIRNMRTLAMRLARRRGLDLSQVAHRLRAYGRQLEESAELEAVRGIEGAATAAYFAALRQFFPAGLGFAGRNRRPPKDPANALLSFGYALLASSVESAVYQVGLDPYLGFLHLVDYGRPSLVLDLMEEFRPVLVDALALDLANHNMVSVEDFEARDNGIFLREKGRRLFIDHFQQRLESRISYAVSAERVERITYRRCLEYQARLLSRAILGEAPAYLPFLVR